MTTSSAAAELVGLATRVGAQRAGLTPVVAEVIGNAVSEIAEAIFLHHDPAALARDLAAETIHRTSVRSAIQAALDAAGGGS
jgi:hypothetical protein